MSFSTVWEWSKDKLENSAMLGVAIVLDSALFVVWIAVDSGAAYICAFFQQHGLHEVCAMGFRWLASGTVFCLAFIQALSDVFQALRGLRKKVFPGWKLVCITCPANHGTTVTK